ncbi:MULTISPECIES: MerR family transcriptional regulator [unclassified Brevundimonas]|uniref:MerR family transcriptional regulator n=1 Tax=unclassified Brevundimonas TaxID=2622653 RepID=UPI0025C605CD|nr:MULTISPECIES: MerR family transcriptional regulator [unclassified Brevundimonas]
MPDMTIGQLAQAGDVGVETIRFYQRRGLMPTPPRGSGYRLYSAGDLKRLNFIRSAQKAGFTLTQIGELVALDPAQDRSEVLHLARVRLEEIEARLKELQGVRDALRSLARTCASGEGETCPIIEAFEMASES